MWNELVQACAPRVYCEAELCQHVSCEYKDNALHVSDQVMSRCWRTTYLVVFVLPHTDDRRFLIQREDEHEEASHYSRCVTDFQASCKCLCAKNSGHLKAPRSRDEM